MAPHADDMDPSVVNTTFQCLHNIIQ